MPESGQITWEMIKYLREVETQMLLAAVNKAWIDEKIPTDWEMRLHTYIQKRQKIHSNNYRSIKLMS